MLFYQVYIIIFIIILCSDQMRCVALSSLSSLISSQYNSIGEIHNILKSFCSVKNIDNYMEFVMKMLKDVFIII